MDKPQLTDYELYHIARVIQEHSEDISELEHLFDPENVEKLKFYLHELIVYSQEHPKEESSMKKCRTFFHTSPLQRAFMQQEFEEKHRRFYEAIQRLSLILGIASIVISSIVLLQ